MDEDRDITDRIAELQCQSDALWLCQTKGAQGQAMLVRGWTEVMDHYAMHGFEGDEPPYAASKHKAKRYLTSLTEYWTIGLGGVAVYDQNFGDGGVTYTLVTELSESVKALTSAADKPR